MVNKGLESKLKNLDMFIEGAMERYSHAENDIKNKAISIGLLGQGSKASNLDVRS